MSFFSNFPTIPINLFDDGRIYNIKNTFRYARIPSNLKTDYLAYSQYQIQNGERPDIVSLRLYGNPNLYWTFFIVNDFLNEGVQNWPLSTQKIQEYVSLYLTDTIINTRPQSIVDIDGILIRVNNSVTGRFDITNKELVTGLLSNATGNVVGVNAQMQQLRITNVNGVFRNTEIISGASTGDQITTFQVFKMYDAPYEYINSNGEIVNNALFFSDGITNANLKTVTYYEKLIQLNDQKVMINIINPSYITEFVTEFQKSVGI